MLSMLGSKWRQYTTGMGKHSPMRHLAPRTSTHVLREPPTGHLPPSTHGATYGYKESRPDGTTIMANIRREDRCISRTHGQRCALDLSDSLNVAGFVPEGGHVP